MQLWRTRANVSERRVKRGKVHRRAGRVRRGGSVHGGDRRAAAAPGWRAPPPRRALEPAGLGLPGLPRRHLQPFGERLARGRTGVCRGHCACLGREARCCVSACHCVAVCAPGWPRECLRLPGRLFPAAAHRGKPQTRDSWPAQAQLPASQDVSSSFFTAGPDDSACNYTRPRRRCQSGTEVLRGRSLGREGRGWPPRAAGCGGREPPRGL